MKIKNLTLTLPIIALLLADIALSSVAIILAPPEARETFIFWFTWAFAAVIGVGLCISLPLYLVRDKATRLIALKSFFGLAFFFECLYIKTFCICAFTSWSQKIKTVYAIVFEILITVAFLILIIVKLFGIHFLKEVNADQARTVEAKKRGYIPELLGMLATAIASTENESIKASLRELSESVSRSPDLSPAAAEMTERELRAIIYQINQYAILREYGEMDELVRKATLKLTERNSKCPAST